MKSAKPARLIHYPQRMIWTSSIKNSKQIWFARLDGNERDGLHVFINTATLESLAISSISNLSPRDVWFEA
jgi:hypothetical protein